MDRWTDMYTDTQADAQKHRARLTSLTTRNFCSSISQPTLRERFYQSLPRDTSTPSPDPSLLPSLKAEHDFVCYLLSGRNTNSPMWGSDGPACPHYDLLDWYGVDWVCGALSYPAGKAMGIGA